MTLSVLTPEALGVDLQQVDVHAHRDVLFEQRVQALDRDVETSTARFSRMYPSPVRG